MQNAHTVFKSSMHRIPRSLWLQQEHRDSSEVHDAQVGLFIRLIMLIVDSVYTYHNFDFFTFSISIGQRHHKGHQCPHCGSWQGSHQLSSESSTGLHKCCQGCQQAVPKCRQDSAQVFISHHKSHQVVMKGRQMRKNIGKVVTCCHLLSLYPAKNFHITKFPVLQLSCAVIFTNDIFSELCNWQVDGYVLSQLIQVRGFY